MTCVSLLIRLFLSRLRDATASSTVHLEEMWKEWWWPTMTRPHSMSPPWWSLCGLVMVGHRHSFHVPVLLAVASRGLDRNSLFKRETRHSVETLHRHQQSIMFWLVPNSWKARDSLFKRVIQWKLYTDTNTIFSSQMFWLVAKLFALPRRVAGAGCVLSLWHVCK